MHAIYELIFKISTTQGRHTNRLAEITEDIAAIRASVAGHDARFGRIEGKLEAHDARFETLETKLDRVLEILER
ncbi:MAG TPA: hypothetical protein VK045_05040 [Ornithinicoccus sp.]|nr:hypothetical protein [Ornithinicoccus sp.]